VQAFAAGQGIPLLDAVARRDEIDGLKAAARRNLGELHAVVSGLHQDVLAMDAGTAVQEAITRSGLMERLRAEGTDEAADKAENLLELVAAAREFDEARALERPPRDPDEPVAPPLARFLEQIALVGEADAPTPEGRVALMTLHAAKGLEFEAVFLCGMEEGMLPYERPWRRDVEGGERVAELDEERRLCYVGMTRARSRLVLSLARRRMAYGESGPSWREREPSRFLGDLPPELFGLPSRPPARPVPAGPVVRRHPGALPGEPVIEYEEQPAPPAPARRRSPAPTVDYSFDQRPESARAPFTRGDVVVHASLGEGLVRTCDGTGPDAKVTVAFPGVGEKRVIAKFLRRA
jgi:ATP-dependent DNA helicase UvrD/PcrA